jgi:spore germination protein GerM
MALTPGRGLEYHYTVATGKTSGGRSQNRQKNNRSLQAGVAFWLIFIVVLLGIFLVKRETIKKNYNTLANRFDLPVWGQSVSSADEAPERAQPAPPDAPPLPPVSTTAPSAIPPGTGGTANQPTARPTQPPAAPVPAPPAVNQTPPNQPPPPATKPPAANQTPAKPPTANQSPANQPAAPPPTAKPPETRERGIYFTRVDADDTIQRVRVSRNIPVSDSPMVDSLNALLAGPTAEERRRGLISLIPANTKIRSATVRGSTAYISFSEEFQFNTSGREGYAAQLREIIWTVTEFPTVSDVQFLIEGRRVDYLAEGIYIGSPVSRDSF